MERERTTDHDSGGESGSGSERACLEFMTPDGQDIYLRLGHSPRRRSALRLTRIIVRHQLLTRLTQEIEAKEACDWLRAAGFPQYAQLYEDSQFPIDILSVKRDHDFLDRDLVEPLYDDDPLAISKRWTFEWNSRRWSRLQDMHFLLGSPNENSPEGCQGEGRLRSTVSSESVLTDLSEPEITDISSLHSQDSLGAMLPDSVSMVSLAGPYQVSLSSATLPPGEVLPVPRPPPSRRSPAKAFLRRMEMMRTWGPSSKRKSGSGRAPLVISGPVLHGEEPQALQMLHCVPINQSEDSLHPPHQSDDNSSPIALGNGSKGQSVTSGVSSMRPCVKESVSKPKRGSMYLEDMELLSGAPHVRRTEAQQSPFSRNHFRSYEDLLVHIPKNHKPGTFPKALSIESLATATNHHKGSPWTGTVLSKKPSCPGAPRGSRVSVYDNVPGSHLYASTGDLLDVDRDDHLFPHLDDIISHVSGLQQIVDHWSRSMLTEGGVGEEGEAGEGKRGEDEGEGEERTTPSEGEGEGEERTTPSEGEGEGRTTPSEGEGEGRTMPSEGERDGVSLIDIESTGTRERRDSGVGASLTRPRLRWPSFRLSENLRQSGSALQISSQSAGQLSLLQKFSLLRLTAIMENYSMSNKHGWTWSVPKFMKRLKVPDYKERSVFGVPLIVHTQRCGYPLPLCLQQALRHLRTHCLDQVGLFRKSGVKSRIQALRQECETSPDSVCYEDQSAYDVADMVKQFFRDLPEPLLTSKLGETFLHIYQYVPKEQRLQAVRAAILLMSDENREVLQTLLCFLRDVTSCVEENQMTPMNLAVCLGPSLFHLNILKNDNLSPRSIQKKYATGRPDQKDLSENLAATQGLAHMITECQHLFEIPQDMVSRSHNSYMEAELLAPPLDELRKTHDEEDEEEEEEEEEGSYHTHMEGLVQGLLKEARDNSKGWVSRATTDHTELACKKVGDGNPLRRWRVCVEVCAKPSEVLERLLRERPLWQTGVLQEKVVVTLGRQTDIYQYSLQSMAPHPNTDYVVLRSWRSSISKGCCVLVCVSVDYEDSPAMVSVRGVILESQYLLEPHGTGKSRLTHICRVDLKGRSPEWYNKVFGHLCVSEAQRIRSSFLPPDPPGTETKI
uniref:StAR-related lipid transfer (START) domain containing 13a n=1 Tax=Oncorhynchus mykiss TaxID=8022 RepID=A0A8L0DPK5_ONCMY